MFLIGTRIVTSASDLNAASKCEYAFARTAEAKLKKLELPQIPADTMLERTARLGDAHEERILQRYRDRFGAGVVEIDRPNPTDSAQLRNACVRTLDAFLKGADVVYQATFATHNFLGYADFIVRTPDGTYEVQDTKLARAARVTALMQLAAYAGELWREGVEPASTVRLILGDGSESVHRLEDIEPVYVNRRQRVLDIVAAVAPGSRPVEWGDPRFTACGRCDLCRERVEATRDVLLVAGMRVTQRAKLVRAGIHTIEQLAVSSGAVEGIGASALAGMREQAQLQLHAVVGEPPPVRVVDAESLAALPEPSAGDIFFDFEGDPLYTEGDRRRWNLDYLFGFVDTAESFVSYWAHSFAEERIALRRFLDDVAVRRAKHPEMHIYHYATYEKTHLASIAARHGVGENEVDELLRQNVLVDLYPIVKRAVRIGSQSYSIKKLEPLYMGDEHRDGEVTDAAASVDQYVAARVARDTGDDAEWHRMLAQIADYNRYDCVSTRRLREWLLAIARGRGVSVGVPIPVREKVESLEPSSLRDDLLAHAGDPDSEGRSDDQVAISIAAAALDYHAREAKRFWQEHYSRLIQPLPDWAETRDVLQIERVEVQADWFRAGRQKLPRRRLRLSGRWAPGSRPAVSSQTKPFLLYEFPGPYQGSSDPGARSCRSVQIVEVADDGSGSVVVEETLPQGAVEHAFTPSALTPAAPPDGGSQVAALHEWGQSVADAAPAWPRSAANDLVRRVPPRLTHGSELPVATPGAELEALVQALLRLDESYLAVQGPPGTGKTWLGAHAIAQLIVEHRWRIGVVAQSHSVVANLLDAVIKAGVPSHLVGKARRTDEPVREHSVKRPFTEIPKDGHARFAHDRRDSGYLIGGTAWDLSKPERVPRRSLDLLVIEEAGQFSLASTLASAVSARNLLLLGDPQQLPQVSQASHPAPVDESALGWVARGNDVLPADRGYFLELSRRMHPRVTEPVSALAYAGQLHSHPSASQRLLVGVQPGLHAVAVEHAGDSVESAAEADAVLAIVGDVLGRVWSDPATGHPPAPLDERGVIVVAPYNAQVARISDALRSAGHPDIQVGTVDRFQGREAAVAIISLAASSPADVPRGMDFLIMKNRLNVAISRAKWAAYLVHSPALTDYLPHSASSVAELSRFIRLLTPPSTARYAEGGPQRGSAADG